MGFKKHPNGLAFMKKTRFRSTWIQSK